MTNETETHGTAEVCDLHGDVLQVLQADLVSYGGVSRCSGRVITFQLDEDNRILKAHLQGPGDGQVAVADVQGDFCAVVGDRLAGFAIENNWAGIVLNGYLRDTKQLSAMPLAIWALGTCPRRSSKRAEGAVNTTLKFGGVQFVPGSYLYADEDGIVVAETELVGINFAV